MPERHAPEPIAQPEPLPDKLAGVAIESGLARVGGNRRLYRTLLVKLRTNYAGTGDEVRRLLNAGKATDAARLAHSVKGVAGNLGADALAGAAAALENALRSGDERLSRRTLPPFEERLDEVVAAISSLEMPAQPSEAVSGPIDSAAVELPLRELARLLESDWIEAQERLDDLRQLLEQTEVGDVYARLARHMENFDAEGARTVAKELAGRLAIAL